MKFDRHGMSYSHGTLGYRTYRAWQMMKQRCTNPKTKGYACYGGRGITYAPEWEIFLPFVAHVGLAPSLRHSLDRIQTTGHYTPGNVRWATTLEQARNRRTNLYITYDGETLTHREWSRRCQISQPGFDYRMKQLGPQEAVRYSLSCIGDKVRRRFKSSLRAS